MESQFCFCGTLCDNTNSWFKIPMARHNDSHGYKGKDFVKMETALLNKIGVNGNYPQYEDDLFAGMCASLEVLKDIHRSRGEDVDNVPVFTKRDVKVKEVVNG